MRKTLSRFMICSLTLALFLAGIHLFTGDASAESGLTFGDFRVDTRIGNHYAETRLSIDMVNDGDAAEEVQFSIDVPDDAMVSNMSITINELTSYAQVKIKEEADQDYDDAKKNGTTATKISGTMDPTFFYATINVEANTTVTWSITYDQLIIKEMGIYTYDLPFGTLSNIDHFNGIEVDIDLRTMEPITDLNLDKGSVIPDGNQISPDHNIITYEADSFTNADNIILEYSEVAPPVNGTIEAYIDDTGGYFMHVFSPQLEDLGAYLPKDIIFILDRSGSMEGRKMEQMKDAFGEIVHQLQPQDDFNVITFATDVTSYNSDLIQASNSNMDDAEDYINNINAYSSTNIDGALERGLGMLSGETDSLPIIVFLTDGNPTEGITDIQTIRQNVLNRNTMGASIYSLGFGDDLDFEFLSALSLENNGYAVKIPETQDASGMMQGFYKTISLPLLMDLYFDYSSGTFQILPTYVPSLFEGSETVVVGRFTPDMERIVSTVTAQTSAGERIFEESYEIGLEDQDDFIPRLWAFRMIRGYQDQMVVQGETPELKEKITELALEYSFITRYTSFILVIKEPEPPQDDAETVDGGTEGQDPRQDLDDDDGVIADNSDPIPSWSGDIDGLVGDDDDDDVAGDWEDDTNKRSHPVILPSMPEDGDGSFPIFFILAFIVVILIVLLFIFGYSRIRKDQLLEQENRKKIYEKILDDPSIHFRGLQRAVDLEVGVLSHHLNILEKEQLIVSEQDGNNRRFWGAGVKHDDNQVRLSRIQENILKSIEKEPGITQSQIAKEIGVSRKVVFYHVKFLSKAGIVREEKEKRKTHYYSRE